MDVNNKEGEMVPPPPNNRPQQEALPRGLLDDEERLSDFGSPKHGPTLSTSTSSFEALDPHDPNLSHLASLMFSHTSNYLQVCLFVFILLLFYIHICTISRETFINALRPFNVQ